MTLCVWRTQKAILSSGFRVSGRRCRTAEVVLIINLLSLRVIGGCLYGCYISTRVRSSSNRAGPLHGGWSRARARAVLSSSTASFTVPHFSQLGGSLRYLVRVSCRCKTPSDSRVSRECPLTYLAFDLCAMHRAADGSTARKKGASRERENHSALFPSFPLLAFGS